MHRSRQKRVASERLSSTCGRLVSIKYIQRNVLLTLAGLTTCCSCLLSTGLLEHKVVKVVLHDLLQFATSTACTYKRQAYKTLWYITKVQCLRCSRPVVQVHNGKVRPVTWHSHLTNGAQHQCVQCPRRLSHEAAGSL